MLRDAETNQPIILSQVIEPGDSAAPSVRQIAEPCQACGAPRDLITRFCVACGSPQEVPNEDSRLPTQSPVSSTSGIPTGNRLQDGSDELPSHFLQCENCGSQVATQADQRSYNCPFCDSKYVLDLGDSSNRRQPEFIIGFAITREQAKEKYFEWLGKNGWLRPGDLARKAVSDKQRGVYLPFWHFAMKAHSQWRAQIGQYWYRTETYTVRVNGKTETRTRRVRETEWWPLNGQHEEYYYGYLVSGSRGLPPKESRAIQPYNLKSLTRYRPFFLAGWLSEEYCIDQPEAVAMCEQEFRQRENSAIARFLPGDTYRNLSVDSRFQVISTDLILLPVHVLSYRYGDRTYRFLVNGQTGKIYGEKPWSSSRIVVLIIVIIILIALISAAIYLGIATSGR